MVRYSPSTRSALDLPLIWAAAAGSYCHVSFLTCAISDYHGPTARCAANPLNPAAIVPFIESHPPTRPSQPLRRATPFRWGLSPRGLHQVGGTDGWGTALSAKRLQKMREFLQVAEHTNLTSIQLVLHVGRLFQVQEVVSMGIRKRFQHTTAAASRPADSLQNQSQIMRWAEAAVAGHSWSWELTVAHKGIGRRCMHFEGVPHQAGPKVGLIIPLQDQLHYRDQ